MRKIFTLILFAFAFYLPAVASVCGDMVQHKSHVVYLFQQQPGDEIDIKVSPNPANDYFSVTSNVTYNRIILYNLLGKPLKSYRPTVDNTYTLTDLPGGIYSLRFLGDDNHVIKTVKLYKKD